MKKDKLYYMYKNEMFIQEMKARKIRLSKQGDRDALLRFVLIAAVALMSTVVIIGQWTGLTDAFINSFI
jgi:hypothetical protein